MPELLELIKNLPKILESASTNERSLAALFFILGGAAIVYLMKDQHAGWRLGAVFLWFISCLVAFALIVGPPPSSLNYRGRLLGQDGWMSGTVFDLNFGYQAADSESEIELQIETEGPRGPLSIAHVEPPLLVSWASGADEEVIGPGRSAVLRVSIPPLTTTERQTREVRLTLSSSFLFRSVPPLAMRVGYQPLPSEVTVEAKSGKRSSGRGQDYSPIYRVCASAPSIGSYTVLSSKVWLTGDRSCGSWAHCEETRAPDGSEACLQFSLQGHSECVGLLSKCRAVRESEGHVKVIFKLEPSSARLAAN